MTKKVWQHLGPEEDFPNMVGDSIVEEGNNCCTNPVGVGCGMCGRCAM